MSSASSRVVLVVRADDAGSFVGANRAIGEALSVGVVRNCSVMAPAAHFADAARRLRGLDGTCVGLHVTLTSEWISSRWRPLLPAHAVRSLVAADGALYATPLELFERGVNLDEAMAEVRAQLARARAAGLDVRYLDEHMSVGWVHAPGSEELRLRHLLIAFAEDEGLVWHERARELPSNVADLANDACAFATALAGLAPDAYAWVTHPAHDEDDDELRAACTASGERASTRTADLARVLSPSLHGALGAAGVRLARYDELAPSAGG